MKLEISNEKRVRHQALGQRGATTDILAKIDAFGWYVVWIVQVPRRRRSANVSDARQHARRDHYLNVQLTSESRPFASLIRFARATAVQTETPARVRPGAG
ncbi:hypothetical protein EVAR_34553_1 [Eumeta japonica]|uniref:Uncharacterized protein n=1 Tax=Eumeta variegata TaxID=151549 RepID=A0A4C1X4A9_EUMVA|nr:hypothetical protein EVAR_34553_1 [Eumeta japonica]